MLARLRPRMNHATVVAYLALFVALGGGALAATGLVGGDGKIKGCVSKQTGAARIVKPGKPCQSGEQALTWSKAGPRGLRGKPGASGVIASGFLSRNPNPNFTLTSAEEYVMNLETQGSGDVVMRRPGRLEISAMLDISSTTATAGECQGFLLPPNNLNFDKATRMGQPGFYSLPAGAADTDREVPVVASADLAAGTYNVVVACRRDGGTGGTFDNGTLNVLAIGL